MYPYEGLLGEDESYWSAALCVLELLRNGVTTFVDPGNYLPHVSLQVVGDAGVRCIMSRSTLDVARSAFGKLPEAFMETTEQCLERSEQFVREWHGAFDGRVRAWFQFRGVNNATDALIKGLKDLADRHGVGVQTHACFAKETMEASLSGYGLPEVERLARLGVLDRNTLLVHGGWLTPREIKLVVDAGAGVVCSPSSSMHNGYGTLSVGKIPELLELGVTVGLGSDHASSGIVDLLQEMFLAGAGYKETRLNSTVMPPERVLEMATVNGARCALWDDEIGSLAAGKRADLVLFDTRHAQWQPLYNPVANLVYSATGASTDVVIVGGAVLVEGGRVRSMDEDRVYEEVRRLMPGILSKTGLADKVRPRWPIL
jgi:5-methylthioadenosine/S-adenosylhomocysteine deaminase